MSLSTFLRVSGLSALIGGLLFLSTPIWFYGFPNTMIGTYADHLGTILVLWGLFGFYLSQSKRTGNLGFISFVIAFLGTAMWIGFKWAHSFVEPGLEEAAPQILDNAPASLILGINLSLFTFFIGWILFSIVTAWKAVLPRWGAILILIGLLADFIPFGYFVAQPLAGIGIAWLGYAVWQGSKEEESRGHV
jgi:hypothetical protein